MKPTCDRYLLEHLEETARQLDIGIQYEPLGAKGDTWSYTGGLCKCNGKTIIFVDSVLTIPGQCHIIAKALQSVNLDHIFVLPAVRFFIENLSSN